MRFQHLKLTKGKSTNAERKVMELLKKYRIPFKTKVKIEGREVDFLVGKYAIEIDSHLQDSKKNIMLLEKGYVPLHFTNWSLPALEDWLKTQKHGNRSRNKLKRN